MLESNGDTFLEESIESLVSVPTLIAGEDSKEMNLSRSQLSKGHDGKSTASIGADQSDPTANSTEGVANKPVQPLRHLWFNRPMQNWSRDDKLLLCGAVIIRNLREDVMNQLGFTCSGGVAHNKILAKLASAMHKPNKQTLVPNCVLANLMGSLPLSRIQGLGGKLGQAVTAEFGDRIKTMGDILTTNKQLLIDRFGVESTEWMIDAAQGIDREPVQDRALPISIGCSKSYRSTMKLKPENLTDGVILKWYGELALELSERIQTDTENNSRAPKQLHIGLSVIPYDDAAEREKEERRESGGAGSRPGGGGDIVSTWWAEAGFSISKIVPMVTGGAEAIAKTSLSLITRALSEHPRMQTEGYFKGHYRITGLSLGANNFADIESGAGAITSFFNTGSAGTERTSHDPFASIGGLGVTTSVKTTSSSCNTSSDTKRPSISSFFGKSSDAATQSVECTPRLAVLNKSPVKTKKGIGSFFGSHRVPDCRQPFDLTDGGNETEDGQRTKRDDDQWERLEDFIEDDEGYNTAEEGRSRLSWSMDGEREATGGECSLPGLSSIASTAAFNSSTAIKSVFAKECGDASVIIPPVTHVSTSVSVPPSHSTASNGYHPQSLMDVDQSVFDALPLDIQIELKRGLACGTRSVGGNDKQLSKLGAAGGKKNGTKASGGGSGAMSIQKFYTQAK
eukprot:gene23301-29514_t